MGDRTGEVLDGKYRLRRLLGSGGMGSVYEADHLLIGKRVAVKFLHAEFAQNPDAVRRFHQEARTATAAGHRGIVDIHDLGTALDGTPYLVMELLDGESLGELLRREGHIAVRLAVDVAIGALSALAAAHRKGIVHRDIKPDNIFLERTLGETPLVKLLDFGVSKISNLNITSMTKSGVALGTPHYMAPEQARGATDLDARVDVYAMGVILYEALTGVVPFDAPNYNALMMRVVTDEPRPPRELRPNLPESLQALILRAMAKRPIDRFRRAEDMIEALLPFTEGSDLPHSLASTGMPSRPARTKAAVDVSAPTLAVGEGSSTGLPGAAGESPAATISMGGDTLSPRSLTMQGQAASAVRHPRTRIAAGLVLVVAVAAVGWRLASSADHSTPAVQGRRHPEDPVPQASEPGGEGPSERSPSERSPSERSPSERSPSGRSPSGPASAGSPNADSASTSSSRAGSAASDSVMITLEGLPVRARVFLNGALVPVLPIRLASRDVMMQLRVEANGYLPFSQMVVPDRNQTVVVSMQRRVGGGHPSGGGGVFRDTSEFER